MGSCGRRLLKKNIKKQRSNSSQEKNIFIFVEWTYVSRKMKFCRMFRRSKISRVGVEGVWSFCLWKFGCAGFRFENVSLRYSRLLI
jgi:hypothetical protein